MTSSRSSGKRPSACCRTSGSNPDSASGESAYSADGTKAVGLFKRGRAKAKITVRFSDLGLNSPRPSGGEGSGVRGFPVRDLGVFADSFTAEVLPHAAWLIKAGK